MSSRAAVGGRRHARRAAASAVPSAGPAERLTGIAAAVAGGVAIAAVGLAWVLVGTLAANADPVSSGAAGGGAAPTLGNDVAQVSAPAVGPTHEGGPGVSVHAAVESVEPAGRAGSEPQPAGSVAATPPAPEAATPQATPAAAEPSRSSGAEGRSTGLPRVDHPADPSRDEGSRSEAPRGGVDGERWRGWDFPDGGRGDERSRDARDQWRAWRDGWSRDDEGRGGAESDR